MRYHLLLSALGLALGAVVKAQQEQIVVGYYPSWKKDKIDGMDLSQYTHINLAFAIPDATGEFTFEGQAFVKDVVTDLHAKGTKALLSVGGWTGSIHISDILLDKDTRQTFMDSMVSYIKDNDLDGIDIDWEFPGHLRGNDCNKINAEKDTPNFLEFLTDLRKALDTTFTDKKLITMAVRVEPFDVNGKPSTDVSDFAKVVDFANIMQYDINGAWGELTGPNAPFNFEEGKGMQASFVSAIDAWTKAGWPAKQLTAGIGFYGRATIADVDMTDDPENQYQKQTKEVPQGDKEDLEWKDPCTGKMGHSGVWQWKHLRNEKVLTDPATAGTSWVRKWDDESKTPWLFNPTTKQFISYDDPQSIKVKMDYAASMGLAGAMVWSIEMDYNGELLNAVKGWKSSTPPLSNGGGDKPKENGPTEKTPEDEENEAEANPPGDGNPQGGDNPPGDGNPQGGDNPPGSGNPEPDNTPLNNPAFVKPVAGGACTTNGQLECADETGTTTAYMVCVNDKWVEMRCGDGTACLRIDGSITCGWPSKR